MPVVSSAIFLNKVEETANKADLVQAGQSLNDSYNAGDATGIMSSLTSIGSRESRGQGLKC